jgi:hypothetical protein
MRSHRRLSTWLVFAAVALFARIALAQGPPDADPGITQTVARISYLDGEVSYARGDDPDTWQDADRNVPMSLGDRVYTGRESRLELELHGGDVVRLGAGSDLTAMNMTEDTRQFALKSGVAFFRVPDLQSDELFEVDTPNAAVTFERSGDYRLDVDEDGNTRLAVHKGSATVAAGGGQVSVGADAGIRIDGLDAPRYEVIGLPEVDAWDRWAGERESRVLRAHSRQYVNASVAGVADLDDYGQWSQVPEYGWVWSPASVAAGWAPYRAGRWIWQDPWGWTWVSTEPWGWAPYHSGRWVFASSRWCWVPVAPGVRVVHYAPALVAFVGAGPGFSASVTVGGGYVGWFPLAPRDPLVPWWGYRDSVRVTQVTNVTYVNQTYVTVVNQNTFVSGRPVSSGVITERAVVQQAASAAVLRGPVPVAPTVASTRVSLRNETTAPRPPAAVAARPVVARVAPPPAPQRFDEKLATIRQNGGAPVRASATPQSPAPRAAAAVKPAAAPEGKVTLAARGGTTERTAQRIEPVAAPKGRALATEGRPVAESPAPPRPASSERVAEQKSDRPAADNHKSAPPPAVRDNRDTGTAESRPPAGRPTPREVEDSKPAPRAVPRAVSPEPQRKAERAAPAPPAANTRPRETRPQDTQDRPQETRERPHSTAPRREPANEPSDTTARPPADKRQARPPAPAASPRPKEKEKQDDKGNGRGQAHPPAPRPTPPPDR